MRRKRILLRFARVTTIALANKPTHGCRRALRETTSHSNAKETTCQDELVIRVGKTNLCRVARPVRKVISHARTVRTATNTASFAGIPLDDEPPWLNLALGAKHVFNLKRGGLLQDSDAHEASDRNGVRILIRSRTYHRYANRRMQKATSARRLRCCWPRLGRCPMRRFSGE